MKTTWSRSILAATPLVGLSLIVFGCSQASTSTTGGTSTATGTGTGTGAAQKAGSGDSVGAAECDEVLKMAASPECKEKPGMSAIVTNRENWKNGISNSATKDPTIQACKAALETIKMACNAPAMPGSAGAPTAAGSGSAAAGGSADSTGAPECDEVLKLAASDGCKDKPGAGAILANKANWKNGVSVSMSKDPTIQACKAALEALKLAGCGGAGGTPTAGGGTWDGKAPFTCSGNDTATITGVTANIAKGPAITASGNCTVTLKDCNITTDNGITASGNGTVNLDGGELKASGTAIEATGNGHVNVKGTKVSGKVMASGNGKVDGVPMTK
jgi:hypothetical protein